MKLRKKNCYVIDGGPGVGKTALLNELAKHQIKTVYEDAREIIRQQKSLYPSSIERNLQKRS